MLEYDSNIRGVEIGVDEVGRGCLFGPVLAAAVVLPSVASIEEHAATWGRVKDSKKLSEKARVELSAFIRKHCVVGFGWMSVADIDRLNILRATMKGMHVALDACFRQLGDVKEKRAMLRIDGNHFHVYSPPGDGEGEDAWLLDAECVVNGDNRYLAIAAASIIAKQERDAAMKRLAEENPSVSPYGILKNKGYGTKIHMDALKIHGATPHHRRSFRPVKEALEMHPIS
jgi:ribonuclease HII